MALAASRKRLARSMATSSSRPSKSAAKPTTSSLRSSTTARPLKTVRPQLPNWSTAAFPSFSAPTAPAFPWPAARFLKKPVSRPSALAAPTRRSRPTARSTSASASSIRSRAPFTPTTPLRKWAQRRPTRWPCSALTTIRVWYTTSLRPLRVSAVRSSPRTSPRATQTSFPTSITPWPTARTLSSAPFPPTTHS